MYYHTLPEIIFFEAFNLNLWFGPYYAFVLKAHVDISGDVFVKLTAKII